METLENNKLIARFMGFEYFPATPEKTMGTDPDVPWHH